MIPALVSFLMHPVNFVKGWNRSRKTFYTRGPLAGQRRDEQPYDPYGGQKHRYYEEN